MDEQTDDLAPNDSEALGVYEPDTPEDVKQTERQEQSKIATTYPIIQELLEWFDTNIQVCDSVTQAKRTANKNGVSVENALIAHDVVAGLLKSQRDSLSNKFGDRDEIELEEE